jgi:hypothetical protein
VRIVGFAGGLAALIAWWMQGFAANRGFLVRMEKDLEKEFAATKREAKK